MRAKEMMLQSVADEDLKKWIWRARSSVNRRDAPREPSAPPPWAEAAARPADAAARDMIAGLGAVSAVTRLAGASRLAGYLRYGAGLWRRCTGGWPRFFSRQGARVLNCTSRAFSQLCGSTNCASVTRLEAFSGQLLQAGSVER